MLQFLDTTAAASAGGGMASTLVMLVLMIGIFYFMLIRPENKRKKEAEQMRSALKVGDEITTIGGITGTVVSVKDDKFVCLLYTSPSRQVRHRDRRRSGPHRVCQVGPVHQRLRSSRRQGRGQEGSGSQGQGQGRQEGREVQVKKSPPRKTPGR